jgi:hypothetical protein
VLVPRSGQDLRFNRLLLKANGTPSSWSYRWSATWTYTFWRPTAPGFPLSTGTISLDEAMAGPQGSDEGRLRGESDGSASPTHNGAAPTAAGESLTATGGRTITITIN